MKKLSHRDHLNSHQWFIDKTLDKAAPIPQEQRIKALMEMVTEGISDEDNAEVIQSEIDQQAA